MPELRFMAFRDALDSAQKSVIKTYQMNPPTAARALIELTSTCWKVLIFNGKTCVELSGRHKESSITSTTHCGV